MRHKKSKKRKSSKPGPSTLYHWLNHPNDKGVLETLDEHDRILRVQDTCTKDPLYVYTPGYDYLAFFDDVVPVCPVSQTVYAVTQDRPVESRHTLLALDLNVSTAVKRQLAGSVLALDRSYGTAERLRAMASTAGVDLDWCVAVWHGFWDPVVDGHYMTKRDMPQGTVLPAPEWMTGPHWKIIRRGMGMQRYVDKFCSKI